MPFAHRNHLATTLFATFVTALALTAQPGQASDEATPKDAARSSAIVHQLPRVVVTGRVHSATTKAVAELPRVVVTGRRTGAASWLVQAPVQGGERS
jgi:hypothetical protein